MSVAQVMEQYQSLLETEVHDIAYETGAVKRKGKLDAATFAQTLIFGFWQDPDLRLSGLAQIGGRREVHVTESAISQRFTSECATMFLKIMQRLAEVTLESEKVEIPLFKAIFRGDGGRQYIHYVASRTGRGLAWMWRRRKYKQCCSQSLCALECIKW